MSSPYPKTMRMLEAWGINPTEVAVDGFDEDGYFTFVKDENGKCVYNYATHEVLTTPHEWPEGCNSKLIVNQYISEGGHVG